MTEIHARRTARYSRRVLIGSALAATVIDRAGRARAVGAPWAAVTTGPLELIKVRYLSASEGLPALTTIYAIAADYFAEEGVELDYLGLVTDAVQVAQAPVTGQADISQTGTAGTLSVRSGRPNLRSIAMLAHRPTSVVVLRNEVVERLAQDGVTPDSPIEDRIRALKGLTLAMPGQGSNYFTMVAMFESVDLSVDTDLTIQSINDAAAVIAVAREGRVDGTSFGPPTGVTGIAEGWGTLWINFATGEVPAVADMPFIDVVTSQEYIEESPEAVRRFLRAVWRASEDVRQRPDHVKGVIKERWFPDLDAGLFDTAFNAIVPAFQHGLIPSEEGWEVLREIYNRGAEQPLEYEFDDLYAVDVTEAARPG